MHYEKTRLIWRLHDCMKIMTLTWQLTSPLKCLFSLMLCVWVWGSCTPVNREVAIPQSQVVKKYTQNDIHQSSLCQNHWIKPQLLIDIVLIILFRMKSIFCLIISTFLADWVTKLVNLERSFQFFHLTNYHEMIFIISYHVSEYLMDLARGLLGSVSVWVLLIISDQKLVIWIFIFLLSHHDWFV